MDSSFNTLAQSYYDNFLQYRLTGSPGYQNSYLAAQKGMDAIIAGLQSEVNSQKQQISDFYKSDVEAKLKDIQSETRRAQRGLVKEKDELTAAEMRQVSTASTIASPVYTKYYIAMGVMGAIVIGLMALK